MSTNLPENWEELLTSLHQEFYSGPKAHADAFRILPKVVNRLKQFELALQKISANVGSTHAAEIATKALSES